MVLSERSPAIKQQKEAPEVRLLSTKDAATYLGISRWKVRDLAVTGELPVFQLHAGSRFWKFDKRDLNAFIDRRKTIL